LKNYKWSYKSIWGKQTRTLENLFNKDGESDNWLEHSWIHEGKKEDRELLRILCKLGEGGDSREG
jgi:hypothetical protein